MTLNRWQTGFWREEEAGCSQTSPNLQADMLLAGRLLARWIHGDTILGRPFNLDD